MGDKELGDKDKDKEPQVATGEGAPRAGGPEEADAGERGCVKARAGTRVPAAGCWRRHPGVPWGATSRDPMGGVGCPSTLCCPRNCPGTTEAPPWAPGGSPGGSPGAAAAFLLGIRTSRGRSRCLQAPWWGLSMPQAVPLHINQLLISTERCAGDTSPPCHQPQGLESPAPGGMRGSSQPAPAAPGPRSGLGAGAELVHPVPNVSPAPGRRTGTSVPMPLAAGSSFPPAESSWQPEPRQQV